MIREWIGTLGALALLASGAAAQVDCFPTKSSNEARMMAKFDVPLAFGAVEALIGVPRAPSRWGSS